VSRTYRRPITSSMARWLIALVRRYEKEPRWYSVSEPWSLAIGSGTGDTAKLLYWGLIKSAQNDNPKKRTSGLWQPTREGFAFAYEALRVKSHALIRDGELIELVGHEVNIRQCLTTKFDYTALMAGEL
jgi:hypothetical protein